VCTTLISAGFSIDSHFYCFQSFFLKSARVRSPSTVTSIASNPSSSRECSRSKNSDSAKTCGGSGTWHRPPKLLIGSERSERPVWCGIRDVRVASEDYVQRARLWHAPPRSAEQSATARHGPATRLTHCYRPRSHGRPLSSRSLEPLHTELWDDYGSQRDCSCTLAIKREVQRLGESRAKNWDVIASAVDPDLDSDRPSIVRDVPDSGQGYQRSHIDDVCSGDFALPFVVL
jgi:hypothetical protein